MAKEAPLYRRIESELRRRIAQGTWASGMLLPSRQSLARTFGVDLTTIQRAIQPLLADGSLQAEKGRGTFVGQTERTFPASAVSASSPQNLIGILSQPRIAGETMVLWNQIVIRAVENTVSGLGGATLYLPTDSLEQATDALREQGAQALVVVDLPSQLVPPSAEGRTTVLPAPFVVVTYRELGYPVSHLLYDQRSSGFLAAEHLLIQGWTELVYLCPFDADWASDRFCGVEEAVRRHGGATLRRWPQEGAHGDWDSDDDCYRASAAFLESSRRRIGVIAANDRLGVGLVRAAAERGWRINRDLGVIGFDDSAEARAANLSSLRPPLEDLGSEAARHLMRALAGRPLAFQVRFVSQMVSRLSSRRT